MRQPSADPVLREVAFVLAVKLAALVALWAFCFAPLPRAPVDAGAVARHWFGPGPPAAAASSLVSSPTSFLARSPEASATRSRPWEAPR